MPKNCNKCVQLKDLTEFSNDRRNSDGKQGICNACKDADKKIRREKRIIAQDYKTPENKTCNKCGTNKAIPEFFADKAMADGKSSICKVCKRENVYKWREANKDKYNADQRAYMKAMDPNKRYGCEIKRRYGCTLEQYNAMLVAQGGACSICKTLHNPAEKKGRLYVDHDHTTGKIRALLCKHCNCVLGYAKDDTRVLSEAIAYLARHKIPA